MEYIARKVETQIRKAMRRNKSVLLLGARQTGKTTLLSRLNGDLAISLVRPDVRQRYEKDPSLLSGEIEALKDTTGSKRPLILIDEIQKVPQILDVLQDLIDRHVANFVLTGSSARKLRRSSSINLLPGRIVSLRLDPLTIEEKRDRPLQDILLYGALPGIVQVREMQDRELDLESYVVTYLEEEVRAEAIVRNLGSFARFLELAALESGRLINLRKLSQEVGVAHTTIAAYYEILEDCLIIDRIDPITESRTRKKLSRSQKFVFFDLGVRRMCAKESPHLHHATEGFLFEQMVGIELLRRARLSAEKIQIKFWRDPGGPEVDWVIEHNRQFTPVEVKWTTTPSYRDIKHINLFLNEYKNSTQGFLVCRSPNPVKLDERVVAIPWQHLHQIVPLADHA